MNAIVTPEYWRRCSSCKKNIGYRSQHYVCSVSTCTRKRTGFVFCSVHCWERHLPGARHRDAAAVEGMSPSFEEWKREMEAEGASSAAGPSAATVTSSAITGSSGGTAGAGSSAGTNSAPIRQTGAPGSQPDAMPRRVIVREMPGTQAASNLKAAPPKEILVVVSKLKAYIRARSEMNTSDAVMDILSDKLRELCDDAIETARAEGRKTVLDRDFK